MLIIAALIIGGYTNHAGNVIAGWPVKLTSTQVALAERATPPANDHRLTTNDYRLTTIHIDFPIADSPLEIWKHLAVKLAFNCLSTGTMAAMGRIAGNWMSWVSISNKKLIDRGIRLLVELGGVSYEDAAQRIFAAEEWVQSQDWTGKEEPCAVQVALKWIRKERQGLGVARGGVG